MIEEILDRLERIDHKEYCGGFEFADSATFEEMGKCFDERKKLANYTKELQQENKQLKKKYENAVADYEYEKYKNNQAIEYIKQYGNLYCLKHTQFKKYKQYEELLEILGDKENE